MSSILRSAPRGAALLFAAWLAAVTAAPAAHATPTPAGGTAALSADPVPSPAAESAPARPGPAPRLTVDNATWSSGEIARDSLVEHTFLLTNEGDAPLVISRIVSTGNVELSVREAEIAPGEKLALVAKTALLKERPGAILKQIELRTNDPAKERQMLEMRILSVEYVKPEPSRARWISVQEEMDGKISPVLTAVDRVPFRILKVSAPPPGITLEYGVVDAAEPAKAPAAGTASSAWKFTLTLAKNAPVGAIVGELMIETDHPKQKFVPIPLSGFMRPVIAVTPFEVKLGEVAHASAKTHEFFVRNFATEPIAVTKVEHDLPGFGAATIETKELGRKYLVKVPMDLSQAPVGPLKGTIKIYTDSRKLPFYSLPVDGTVQP
jgi:hypothetical protein